MSGALAGLVILVIGDSQMMNMLTDLHHRLEDTGAAVHSFAMCGATAGDYIYPSTVTSCGRGEQHSGQTAVIQTQAALPTFSLPQLIDKYHPNLIVVELGDAMAGYGMPQMQQSWITEQVHALTARIAASNITCNWVGPVWGQDVPPYKKTDARVREMSQLLAGSVAPCKYIDSTAFARPGEWQTRDGAHLFPDGYRKYATSIAGAIVQLNGQRQTASH